MFTQRTYYTEYTENKVNFSIRLRTDFSIHQNRARCPLSYSKAGELLSEMCSPDHGKVCIEFLDTF